MITTRFFPSLLFSSALCISCVSLAASAQAPGQNGIVSPNQAAADEASDRAVRHQSTDWMAIQSHLPDPSTASSAQLELAADVLRARRLPEDALEYYRYALNRASGDPTELLNRIGVTELELHRNAAAVSEFKRLLAAAPKNAEGWNNLGAAEYVQGNYIAAVFDYRKAVKLNKKAAVFHSNLGTAYFEKKDYEGARVQFELAVKLDPQVFQHGGWGGVQAHVMSPDDRGRFCFEMAKLAARTHDDASVLLWLGRATEAGYDIRREMRDVKELEPYQKDERVALLEHNAKAMRARQVAVSGQAPALPAETPKS